MSRTVLTDVSGWTPLIDSIVVKHGLVTASVFGIVWRHCQMSDGVCRASMETLATRIGVDRRTFFRHIDTLVKEGYLKDLTPTLTNRPHVYVDTGKAGIRASIIAISTPSEPPKEVVAAVSESHSDPKSTVSESHSEPVMMDPAVTESHTTVTESHTTVTESHMSKTLKRDSLKDTGIKDAELAHLWDRALVTIQQDMNKHAFEKWLAGTVPLGVEGGVMYIQTPTEEKRAWCQDRMSKIASRTLLGILPDPVQVEFVTSNMSQPA